MDGSRSQTDLNHKSGLAERKKHLPSASDDWVKLNIGGTVYQTTKTTLCREPDSFLCRLVKDDQDLPSLKVLFGATAAEQ